MQERNFKTTACICKILICCESQHMFAMPETIHVRTFVLLRSSRKSSRGRAARVRSGFTTMAGPAAAGSAGSDSCLQPAELISSLARARASCELFASPLTKLATKFAHLVDPETFDAALLRWCLHSTSQICIRTKRENQLSTTAKSESAIRSFRRPSTQHMHS
jgi:hypothetical protein